MAKTNPRIAARLKRKSRVRKKIKGTAEKPRLNVFRSNKHMYVQVIDDVAGKTLVAASTLSEEIKVKTPEEGGKKSYAKEVGLLIARKAKAQGIESVVFDRNGFLYHGRIRAIAEGAREGGLKF